MKCYVCGCDINDYGNNPFPLCARDDYESRCCDDCNNAVIRARLMIASRSSTNALRLGDMVAVLYSKNSTAPTEFIVEHNNFLVGNVEEILFDKKPIQYKGTWGNFILDENDQFVKL